MKSFLDAPEKRQNDDGLEVIEIHPALILLVWLESGVFSTNFFEGELGFVVRDGDMKSWGMKIENTIIPLLSIQFNTIFQSQDPLQTCYHFSRDPSNIIHS